MRGKRKGSRQEDRGPSKKAQRSAHGTEGEAGKSKSKKARSEEGSTDAGKATPIAGRDPEAYRSEAEGAFWSLSRKERNVVRAGKVHDSYEDWYGSDDKYAKREKRKAKESAKWKGFGSFLKIDTSSKRLAKEIRVKDPAPRVKNQWMALLRPATIVADDPEVKSVIADAGTIVQLCDQTTLYRDRMSVITHRGDERLVLFGKPDKPKLGWLSVQSLQPKAMKEVKKGPTFLVATGNEASASAWDRLRLKIGRARKGDASEWMVPWLARNGAKHPEELRALVREFGGKPIKNEGFDARCVKVFKLILHSEIDMATAKAAKKKGKKAAKAKDVEVKTTKKSSKKSAKEKPAKKEKSGGSDRITSKHDDHIIRRLVKENPRRAGSEKAKIWDRIKKGMTVGTFITKGGTRGAVRRYIQNGWIKLLRPAGESED